jgi:TRAP-type mannitol/chloroaromatic compound transport system permease small subunit
MLGCERCDGATGIVSSWEVVVVVVVVMMYVLVRTAVDLAVCAKQELALVSR